MKKRKYLLIKSPPLNFVKQAKTVGLVILITLVSSCSPKKEEDKIALFLENVLIRENGLFVLAGSKPMSDFTIEDGRPETDEELKQAYLDFVSQSGRTLTFEDFAKSVVPTAHQDYKSLWQEWNETYSSTLSSRYRFISRRSPFGRKLTQGLFINVPNVLYTLREHYPDFCEVYGESFDPEEVLEEISDDSSLFWNKIFTSHYCQGLLFGYGKRNSFVYDWSHKQTPVILLAIDESQRSLDKTAAITFKKKVTLNDLSVPLFGSGTIADPIIEKYKNERAAILKQFSNKTFKSDALDWLTKQ